MAFLTIFSAPKPFTNPHIDLIQRNAIRSWVELGPEVEVLLIGEEAGLAEAARNLGVRHLPDVRRNSYGTPLVSSMFDLARQASVSPLLACVNADILLFPDLIHGLRVIHRQASMFLTIGQRWDLDITAPLDTSTGWQERLRQETLSRGKLHRASGSDYFVFPRDGYTIIPDFAIGRAGWDNWMIYEGRARGWPVVDASPDIMVVHQNHDYSHLPGGQPHYRLPETADNVRMMISPRCVFELRDGSHCLENGKLTPAPLTWNRFWREVEIFPLVKLRSPALAEAAYTLFHPYKAYAEFRARGIKRKG
jgi:hypothetical protein